MKISTQDTSPTPKISKHRWAVFCLTVLTILLAVLTAAIPGILLILRRADAQVALGNAKSLRLALEMAALECYASDKPFADASCEGGVAGEVLTQALTDSKAPGDFWILQTDESGYELRRFLYQEGDFTVLYQKEPLTYEVYYRQTMIQTNDSRRENGS